MLHSVNPGQVAPTNQSTASGFPGVSNLPGYVERRDLQHALLWDREEVRITFADDSSPEEAALSKLFDKAREQDTPPPEHCSLETASASCQWLLELAAHSAPSTILSSPAPAAAAQRLNFSPVHDFDFSSSPETPQRNRKTYTLADLDYEFFGLETVMQVPSYEKLLRTTSYQMLEARLSGVNEMPLGESRQFDVSLQKVVDSADLCLTESPAQTTQASASRQQVFRTKAATVAQVRAHAQARKLRMLDARVESRASWWFGAGDARDILQNVWDRFVSRKNASLMLHVMRRRIKTR